MTTWDAVARRYEELGWWNEAHQVRVANVTDHARWIAKWWGFADLLAACEMGHKDA